MTPPHLAFPKPGDSFASLTGFWGQSCCPHLQAPHGSDEVPPDGPAVSLKVKQKQATPFSDRKHQHSFLPCCLLVYIAQCRKGTEQNLKRKITRAYKKVYYLIASRCILSLYTTTIQLQQYIMSHTKLGVIHVYCCI